ncbi:Glutamate-gated chloride channel subunit 3 [Fasciolopsis buskii]|uniref:Glutamate-gated chloride channel subunit 3 n=1 Tax=Fasciolopsis buskii TaxID=27845 RepID=A0A8E0RTJ2_9TREM|nr:Glutamate-gated chloride channel subunit 3 [Fasciolopsis buski]
MLRLRVAVLLWFSLTLTTESGDGILFDEDGPKLQIQTPNQVSSVLSIMNETYNRHEIPRMKPTSEENGQTNQSTEIPPLLVDVNMYVYSFSSISVVDMDYTIDFLLRQRWQDSRLKFLFPEKGKRKPISYLKGQLWLPDLFFRNAKNGFLHTITKPNYLIWLDSNGTITFSQKLSLKVSCHMTLEKFPMDTQSCKVNIGSYGYAIDYLDFRWWRGEVYMPTDELPSNASARNAIEIRSDLEINEFKLINYDAYYCAMQYSSTGRFSCLEVKFDLQRRFGFYLIYAYLPSMLIVVIAWVSFLLDPSAVPGRVSIGLLCVLALITQSAAILTQLPRVSYVKAIDIWVFICLAFVVSSLLEFAAANTTSRRQTKRQQLMDVTENSLYVVTSLSALTELIQTNGPTKVKPLHKKEDTQATDNVNPPLQAPLAAAIATCDTEASNAPSVYDPVTPMPCKIFGYDRVNKPGDGRCQHVTGVHRLDLTFAIGYPILFILFNIAYWTYFFLL